MKSVAPVMLSHARMTLNCPDSSLPPAACLKSTASNSGATSTVPFPVSIPTTGGAARRTVGCGTGVDGGGVKVAVGLGSVGGESGSGCREVSGVSVGVGGRL